MIYFDTCMLICVYERDDALGDRVREAMRSSSDRTFAISPLVKLECLVNPMRSGNYALIQSYEGLFPGFENLTMDEETFLRAAELRARFGLKTPDALHLAVAQLHHCSAFWTNDDRLAAASQGLSRRVI
ncbi:MAG: type II toxin-antitoxin system VapC family toxin [Thermomicrobiales bacterium]